MSATGPVAASLERRGVAETGGRRSCPVTCQSSRCWTGGGLGAPLDRYPERMRGCPVRRSSDRLQTGCGVAFGAGKRIDASIMRPRPPSAGVAIPIVVRPAAADRGQMQHLQCCRHITRSDRRGFRSGVVIPGPLEGAAACKRRDRFRDEGDGAPEGWQGRGPQSARGQP